MNLGDLEDNIVTRLAPISQAGYKLEAMPNVNASFHRIQGMGAVTIQAAASEFKDQQSTPSASVQDEWVFIEAILRAKTLRGTGGIYDLKELVQGMLLGWTPVNATKPMVGVDFGGMNPEELREQVWTYSVRFAVPLMSSGKSDDETAVLITQITTDNNSVIALTPTVEMFASQYSVDQSGDQATIIWTADNAEEVSIDGIGIVEPSGTHTVTITETTTFVITATSGSQSAVAEVEITL